MRYGNPSVDSVLRGMREQGVERLLVVPLYPQYAGSSVATALDEVFRSLLRMRNMPEIRTVRHFHDFPPYIEALARQVEAHWQANGRGDKLLMSFHGVPRFTLDNGVVVTVIAGASHGVTGAVTREATAPTYLDVHLPAGARFEQTLPAAHNAFVYVYRGEARLGDTAVPVQRMAILRNEGDGVLIEAQADTRLLLIAGQRLNEPIAQYGPFVMNTQQEIYQAVNDFRAGRLA